MNLAIDNDNMKELIRGAIFEALGAEGREALVADAIKYLTIPPDPSKDDRIYGKTPNAPIEEMFRETVSSVFKEMIAVEMKKSARFKRLVTETVEEGMTRWVKDSQTRAVERIIDHVDKAISKGY